MSYFCKNVVKFDKVPPCLVSLLESCFNLCIMLVWKMFLKWHTIHLRLTLQRKYSDRCFGLFRWAWCCVMWWCPRVVSCPALGTSGQESCRVSSIVCTRDGMALFGTCAGACLTNTHFGYICTNQMYMFFGCESSPISRNVRSSVSQSVSQLVRQMQNKAK